MGSIVVSRTSGNTPGQKCAPTDQEGDVTATMNVQGDVNSASDYEVGVRIVPFDAEPLQGGVTCQ